MPAHEILSAWESFYVIVGSSAGALTGLQFVVMALVSESDAARGEREIAAFGTPTVVHFCVVLLISAVISAPWPRLSWPAMVIGLSGGFGIVYSVIVALRAHGATQYQAVLEDWIWHVVLPFVAYVTLVVAAANMLGHEIPALFGVAASSVVLVFIGIHNAWDTVTWVTVGSATRRSSPAEGEPLAPTAAGVSGAPTPSARPASPPSQVGST
ncbi:MAG TPA: hypothetical protein VFT29_11095 [Gemmatimonadaceae bacterium]|nr:hypothetical protein [Gemmatimonadaceae bacterium]